ncbi:MAG: fibrinogen-like YCDxxxxGGGW domain-containing protein [Candidatus Microsaccharimonas sp.]
MIGRARRFGFTIVELLIVIVVIGILAAITIVAYNGIQNRAKTASIQADVSNAQKKIKIAQIQVATETYPSSITSCPTPVAGALCITSANNTLSYQVDNSVSPASYCFSAQANGGDGYYVDESGKVLPGSCALKSCYEIQQVGGSKGTGVYWIQPSTIAFRVYCDMQTSGGGWTLIMTNPGPYSIWDTTKTLTVNTSQPSISSQYSIVSRADTIKTNFGGNLRYRFDAAEIGRWGGVWEAPFALSFTSTTNPGAANATNIEQYDSGSWTIDTNFADGASAPTNVMPYMLDATRLLTTSTSTSSWYGTLVSYSGSFSPAPWRSGGSSATNPGIIWYWVR